MIYVPSLAEGQKLCDIDREKLGVTQKNLKEASPGMAKLNR